MSRLSAAAGWVRSNPWRTAYGLVVVAILARNLADLSGSPPGLYVDEASVGYNAWAIAHTGRDEHGAVMPLYFQAFGEFKNPVYIYLLAPLTWFLPLTSAVIRAPAALFGLITCLALASTVRCVTRREDAALATLVVAGFNPWLTLDSRLGFEVTSMVAALSLAIWCVARASRPRASAWWFLGAGGAMAVAIYGYSTGRLEVAAFTVALLAGFAFPARRWRGWSLVLLPVLAAYGVLLFWNSAHPGALLARFETLSIVSDNPPLGTAAARLVGNYLQYFNPVYLFDTGDAYIRQNTKFDGPLALFTAPLVLAGLWRLLRHWREGFERFLILGLLAAPVAASLTGEDTPHSLRSITMLPFLLVITGLGIVWLSEAFPRWLPRPWPRVAAGVLSVLVIGEGLLYNLDLFASYPSRVTAWFDVGFDTAIADAHRDANGHPIYLMEAPDFDQPYIVAAVMYTPAPPDRFTDNSAASLLRPLGMTQLALATAPSFQPGDIVVEGAGDAAPSGGQAVDTVEGVAVVYRIEAAAAAP